MTDTTECAELASRIEAHINYGTSLIIHLSDQKMLLAALRTLLSQDQKPVAHPYVKNIDGSPLYLSPPPDAGWDDAIEAAKKIAHGYDDDVYEDEDMNAARRQVVKFIARDIEALRATPAATKSDDDGCVQSEYERGFEAGRKSWGTIIEQHKAYTAELETSLSHQPAPVAANASAEAKNYLYWAVGRWNAEVLSRPLQNIHRRSFDAAWRQVIRHFGGDDRELCGPTHDELLDWAHPHASETKDVDWDDVRGIAPNATGNLSSEEFVRNLRDEWPDPNAKTIEAMRELEGDDHASDCDKQGCMSDTSPGDAKDLQELLNSPSVLDETTKFEGGVEGHAATSEVVGGKARLSGQGSSMGFESPDGGVGNEATARQAGIKPGPSDRPADVTVDDIALVLLDGLKAGKAPIQIARALLDAYGMWRR